MKPWRGYPIGSWRRKAKGIKGAEWKIRIESNGRFSVSLWHDGQTENWPDLFDTFAAAEAYTLSREPGEKRNGPLKVTELFA